MASLVSPHLLQILSCPVCHCGLKPGPSDAAHAWLQCSGCSRYYPVQDGIPVMLEQRATLQQPPA